jgi:kanamycin kinase
VRSSIIYGPGVSTAPPVLAEIAPEWAATLASAQFPEVSTWRLVHPDGRTRFAKVDVAGQYPTLRDEADRMVWAAAYLPVPIVVELVTREDCSVLVTEALPGRDATDDVWRADLPGHVSALARGLVALHGAVGEEWCPFRFEVDRALEHVERRLARGELAREDFHEEHQHLSPSAALAQLEKTAPDGEDLVVCHGDYCAPNVLLEDGRVTGYVDLGELGVADQWWDIAVGAWSVGWNFGTEYEPLFYESYGIEPDPGRIAFYRLLYDLVG